MGSLHKKLKKYSPGAATERAVLGDDTFDQLHPLGTQAESAYDASKAAEAAAADAEKQAAIPLPDEEELERQRRRRNSRRGGGRASTVLSDEDRLGV